MTEPRLLITGSGRSGTGYIATVLNQLGVRCGHEGWWNPTGLQESDLAADASWCALAMEPWRFAGTVVHQVRHPLDVISSLAKLPDEGVYRELRHTLMPWVPTDPIEHAMLSWFTYVEAAERLSALTYRIDDIDGPLVNRLARLAGVDARPGDAERLLANIPETVNWHGAGPRLNWVELPKGGLRDSIMDWARTWGWT